MLEDARLGGVLPDDFLRVRYPILGTAMAAGLVRDPGVGVHQGRLNLEGGLLVHAMSVNDMLDGQASKLDLTDALDLVARVFSVDVGPHMSEDPIPLSHPDIEGL